jgi:hypothetical protein
MLKNCLNCDNQFDGDEIKFCSLECSETYKRILTELDHIVKSNITYADSFVRYN